MLRLDEFTANVAKSGLVPPEVVDLHPIAARSPAGRRRGGAAGAATDRRGLAHGLPGPQAPCRERPAGSSWAAIDSSAHWAKGAWGKFTWPSATIASNVAIKVLPPRKALEEENALRRFRREMDLSQRCSHPNLARTLSVGNDGDVHFMVMEYIPGKSLYQLVKSERDGPLRVPDAARLFLKLVDGLEAAHRRRAGPSRYQALEHHDHARRRREAARHGPGARLDDETGLTRANTVLGTLDYASPEQLRDAAKADAERSVQRRLHALFRAGRPGPLRGGRHDQQDLQAAAGRSGATRKQARGVPAAFAAVVRKLMSKEPEERHQNCAELRGDLARWTDPARVRAILGAEADAARSFRPPPPELVEEDLRLLDRDDPSSSRDGISLRDLGGAEPSMAPRHQAPMPPLPAIIRSVPQSRIHHANHSPACRPTTRAGCSSSPSSPPSPA